MTLRTVIRLRTLVLPILALSLGALLFWGTLLLGQKARQDPARCPAPFLSQGARCCAPGQSLKEGFCQGLPETCGPQMERVEGPPAGCVLIPQKIILPGGSVTLGPTDWDSPQPLTRKTWAVRRFAIDQSEVTYHRYQECLRAGICQFDPRSPEPGLPVSGISREDAETFCAFAGGQLPTPAQWVYAAASPRAHRFPWGAHGLVCRRASYGLAEGPCAQGGRSPELAGMRPLGESPTKIFDLAGNVAEWSYSPQTGALLHGGSFRSQLAAELKTWSTQAGRAADDVGFRCAYALR